ncbi:MAG: methyl-accepting chemotaxis protein [Pseudobdellovibrio sp.]
MIKRIGFVRSLLALVVSVGIFMVGLTGALMWNSAKTLKEVFHTTETTLDQVGVQASLIKAAALAHSNGMAAVAEHDQDTRMIRVELTDGFIKEFVSVLEKCKAGCEDTKVAMTEYQANWSEISKAITAKVDKISSEKLGTSAEKIFEKLDKSISAQSKEAQAQLNNVQTREEKSNIYFAGIAAILVLGLCSVGFIFQLVVSKALSSLSGVISTNVIKTYEAVHSLHDQVEILNSSSFEQVSAIHQTSSSMDEINSMASAMGESAKGSDSLSQVTQAAAEQGKGDLLDLLQSIDEIKASNENVEAQVTNNSKELFEIVRMISEIKEKTKVINDIVFQTRLLSFNASVEAARAGEHGKGFSVVAEEVGKLARMSGESANEISQLLETSTQKVEVIIKKGIEDVSILLKDGESKIKSGEANANRCKTSFEKIVDSMSQLRLQIQHVSGSIVEQGRGLEEIGKATKQIGTAGEGTMVSAQHISTQTIQMREQTQSLKQVNEDLNQLIHGSHVKKLMDSTEDDADWTSEVKAS